MLTTQEAIATEIPLAAPSSGGMHPKGRMDLLRDGSFSRLAHARSLEVCLGYLHGQVRPARPDCWFELCFACRATAAPRMLPPSDAKGEEPCR